MLLSKVPGNIFKEPILYNIDVLADFDKSRSTLLKNILCLEQELL